jgi:hypothetical protein
LLCLDSSSSIILGGRAFIEKFDNKEIKGDRLYSFITNSSRLYSFIDDMLDGTEVDMSSSMMEDNFMQQLPDAVLVHAEDMRAGWHPSHDDDSYIDDSAHSVLGGDALFSVGPVSITDVHRGEVN